MIFELDVKESNRIIVNVNSRWQYMYKPKKGENNMIKLKKDNFKMFINGEWVNAEDKAILEA